MLPIVIAGLLSGLATTVAGMGGGLMLLIALTVLLDDPVTALVVSSPALLLGNVHRLWMYRSHVDRPIALGFVSGAMPAAFVAGLLVVSVPEAALRWLLFGVALVAATRGLGLWSFRPKPAWGPPLGVLAGGLHSTAGGAGVVLAPYLMARELVGPAYVGTMAATAVGLHLARLAAYGAGGLVDGGSVGTGLLLAGCIMVGNAVGARVSLLLSEASQRRVQVGALLATAGLAVVGVGAG